MRICFVSREIAGVRGGGIGTYVVEAARALRAGGHEVWLLTEAAGPGESLRGVTDFDRVVEVGEGVPAAERPDFFYGGEHYAHSYLAHQTLRRIGESFDYVEFPDYGAEGLVAFQAQRSSREYAATVLGLTLHTPLSECLRFDKQAHRIGPDARRIMSLEDEAIRLAPLIHCPSQGLEDLVARRLEPGCEIGILRYPMQLASEAPSPPSPKSSLSEVRCLYFGRIEPRKGVEELVTAFALLPELHLTLIGKDEPHSPYGKSFREYVERRAPANVRFENPLPRTELLARLLEYDVCVLPSLFENWPNTCLEAMAASRVVVGGKHGGMAEMIEDGVTGFHVDGSSPEDIARVIRDRVGASLDRLDAIGRAAAVRIRELSDPSVFRDALVARVRSASTASEPEPIELETHRVSIVIPFFTDRDTIDEAVDSACRQTHQNLEILLVNDGSPLPNASSILERQKAKDRRVRVIDKRNGGLSSARNEGIEHADGEFLLFLDADNRLRPDYARVGVEQLVRHPLSGFVAPHVQSFDDRSGAPCGVYNPLPFERSLALVYNCFGDAGAFFRRSTFLDHGLRYDETLISYEDWALWMDLAAAGVRGELVPRVLYDYRVRGDSMLHADGQPNFRALIGLLIQRHLPGATDEEREMLTTIFQVAGDRIANAPPLRHKIVDELSRLSSKIPLLNRTLRDVLGRLAKGRRRR